MGRWRCLQDFNTSSTTFIRTLVTNPVITPWNNIRYNIQTSNLAIHGLHPHYQHFLFNLPQLIGPALILLLTSLPLLSVRNPRFLSATTGAAFLSMFPHQEPRFLLPCVPLLLTCIRLPTSNRGRNWFWSLWLIFNLLLGMLMGIYHQGGVVPAQLQVAELLKSSIPSPSAHTTMIPATIFWWKTYPPPTYLLGNTAPFNISTVPLMGLSQPDMLQQIATALPNTCNLPLPPHRDAPPPQHPAQCAPEPIRSHVHVVEVDVLAVGPQQSQLEGRVILFPFFFFFFPFRGLVGLAGG